MFKAQVLSHISSSILHNIVLHFLDPKLVKMTVECGICHINTKTYIQYN
jgi:hypothetical protein